MLSGFARSGILERERLRGIAAALGARYVLQPGLGAFSETLADKFEIAGSAVSLEEIAEGLWARMIQDSLLEGRPKSRSSSGH